MTIPSNPSEPTDTPLAQRLVLAGEGAARHDGWTAPRMAAFVDALAQTGCVEAACAHVGMAKSGLYEARRRNPLFAQAWEDALIDGALPRLADELLSVAFRGSVERYYRDGEMVGEKRFTDARLGLALLKRLDRKAAERAAQDEAARLQALAEERAAAHRAAMEENAAGIRDAISAELDEVDDMPFSEPTLDRPHPSIRRTPTGWQTNFPPPAERAPEDQPTFDGYDPEDEEANPDDYLADPLDVPDLDPADRWPGSPYYKRYCTAAEAAALDQWVDRQLAPEIAEHARFFATIAAHRHADDATLLLPPGWKSAAAAAAAAQGPSGSPHSPQPSPRT